MLHQNSYKLAQACDWLTALFPSEVKCEVQTTSHQQMSPKHARCPPRPTHLPQGWNCKSLGLTGKAIFLHTGRSNCKWLLLYNFALMWLENLHQFSNLHNNFQFNAISQHMIHVHAIFCRRLADSDITVTNSVKCMDWLHQWYNHAVNLVSSSTALASLNNRSEKRKSTSPGAMQVRNWWQTIGTEEKLDAISWLRKGWMKCYI